MSRFTVNLGDRICDHPLVGSYINAVKAGFEVLYVIYFGC